MKKESNFFNKEGVENENADASNDADAGRESPEQTPIEIDEKTGRVLTSDEIAEREKIRKENPNWWREQE